MKLLRRPELLNSSARPLSTTLRDTRNPSFPFGEFPWP